MDIFLQQLINGLVVGAIYALIALGYTMVYGILQLINFAHGEIVMMGAMLTISALNIIAPIHLPGPVALVLATLIAMPLTMLIGFAIERIAYRPLRKAPRLAPLITAIGMSIILQQLAVLFWGNTPRTFPDVLPHDIYEIGGASITQLQVGIIVLAIVIMVGLLLMVERTRLGRAMRAVSQNPSVASIMGVNVNQIVAATFVIGSGLGCVAGVMVGANYGLAYPTMGFMVGLKAFTAAVLGGIGNLAGAVIGGLVLGLVESFGAGYLGPLTNNVLGSQYQDIFAFLVLILVLVFRPSGLMGERVAERA
ncbi:branched-chain amino acid ABC transporter permease [Burkholderiaceae bacterium DAT-1]|nr:branched-chain amino acid ABC transporter permease [Burkholderiaceae bacterium DAT-1]